MGMCVWLWQVLIQEQNLPNGLAYTYLINDDHTIPNCIFPSLLVD